MSDDTQKDNIPASSEGGNEPKSADPCCCYVVDPCTCTCDPCCMPLTCCC